MYVNYVQYLKVMAKKQIPVKVKRKREGEVRVEGVAKDVRVGLRNISKHIGISFASFMKSEFRLILEKYPEKYKQPLQP